MQTAPTRVLGPADGKAGFLGSIGVRFMIDGETTSGGFSLVEHPMSARALAAPLHRHLREDEYSYVLEGRLGALLGEDVLEADPRGNAAGLGIETGDVILEVAGKAVKSPADFDAAIAAARRAGKHVVMLRVQAGDTSRFVALRVG